MDNYMSTRAKNMSADERRAMTVQVVLAIAAEQDPGDITTAAIAERMQVTQGALFRHFPSKDAIWGSVITWVTEQLMARIERSAVGMESPTAAMQAMFMAHIDFVSEHPGVPRMLFGVLQRPGPAPAKKMAQRLLEMYSERLHGLIERAKTLGEANATLDTRAAALLFIGSIQGLVMQSMMSGDVLHIARNAPGVFAVYLRGLRH
jgi:TetR/AcrR family transcriptional regulator